MVDDFGRFYVGLWKNRKMAKQIKTIAVYCGSKSGNNKLFEDAARDLGCEMARRSMSLVYGAGSVGLMGILADSVLKLGGRVTGVVPRQFIKEVVKQDLSEIIYVNSMSERKLKMIELSDANIALPGGFGTFDEIFEALVLLQLGESGSPCGFLNVDGYYDSLKTFLDLALESGFLDKSVRSMAIFEDTPAKLISSMQNYKDSHDRSYWKS